MVTARSADVVSAASSLAQLIMLMSVLCISLQSLPPTVRRQNRPLRASWGTSSPAVHAYDAIVARGQRPTLAGNAESTSDEVDVA